MLDDIELTIVMPCLDEEHTLGACVDEARGYLDSHSVAGEVVIADNGSSDRSVQVAEEHGARVVHVPKRGYGAALAGGITAARGRYVVMGDCDKSYDFRDLDAFLGKLRDGYDMVVGNRFQGCIEPGAMPWLNRYFGNPFLTFVGRLFFGTPCHDFYCGQRAFRREAIEAMQLRSQGMEYALEMLAKGTKMGLCIGEVPVTLRPDGRGRPPHLRRWRDGWRSLRFFLLYSPRWMFLYPGIAMMVLGLAVGAWLLPGPREVAGTQLDVHTLAYASVSVVLGLQLVVFSVIGKLLALISGLHPPHARLERWLAAWRLELGALSGLVLGSAGLALSLVATAGWVRSDFGELDPFHTMRLVIPGGLLICVGIQAIIASFLIGMVQPILVKVRRAG